MLAKEGSPSCLYQALNGCTAFLAARLQPPKVLEGVVVQTEDPADARPCGSCGQLHPPRELAQGSAGEPCCRSCLRAEDELLLEPTPFEQDGLDGLASVLDSVSWTYWKPGKQPAQILDWLFLGDLKEALDLEALAERGITAVLNLMHWWELSTRFPEVSDFEMFYNTYDIDLLVVDSEDRLFFDLIDHSWPQAASFLSKCKAERRQVLVNCKAGHNRSACICICWLLVHEGMTLMEAVSHVQTRRGTVLSNHGFRLQLVRLALKLGQLGDTSPGRSPSADGSSADQAPKTPSHSLQTIISKKRMQATYDYNSKAGLAEDDGAVHAAQRLRHSLYRKSSIGISMEASMRALSLEQLGCLYHLDKTFSCDYEYTANPPTIVGSGFSGNVVLCRPRENAAVSKNKDFCMRCVKSFDLKKMSPNKLNHLHNEATIYLSLAHPHIARLFDVYENQDEVSFVMQYCSGGNLDERLKLHGAFSPPEFQALAVPMLMALNYIHRAGIVHRDIKPQNFVFEADGSTIKLIDFGFSVKSYLSGNDSAGDLQSLTCCMGTLGYLAPEVVRCRSRADAAYTVKCDIWSLGVVFTELVTGEPAFHRERGTCNGWTEEVVLREIEDISDQDIESLLTSVPRDAHDFFQGLLMRDPAARFSSLEALRDSYLAKARDDLRNSPHAMPIHTILERFRAHAHASKTKRAWLLAVARSPTCLPWSDFCILRDTFKVFDSRGLSGSINLETFLSVVLADAGAGKQQLPAIPGSEPNEDHYWDSIDGVSRGHLEQEVRDLWQAVCGDDSLSYCEFLAVLLPPIEDVFEDVEQHPREHIWKIPRSFDRASSDELNFRWDPSRPVSDFLLLLQPLPQEVPIFGSGLEVAAVTRAMNERRLHWVIVEYSQGHRAFFDYMDINRKLLELSCGREGRTGAARSADDMARLSSMAVGTVANCSKHSAYLPMPSHAPLCDILRLIAQGYGKKAMNTVRRVPIMDPNGKVLRIFSCTDFLQLAMKFLGPTAVLQSRAARTLDRRSTIQNTSVLHEDAMLDAMRIMDTAHLNVCPVTSWGLSRNMGGVVAGNVVSVADLKLVLGTGEFSILTQPVADFIAWRASVTSSGLSRTLRKQWLRRFNVVSMRAGDSLHMLAHRLLESKLQRIFLSCDEIARIVGSVSSRDILLEVLDELLSATG